MPIAIHRHGRRARAGPFVAPRVDGLVVRGRTASEHSPSARAPDEPIAVCSELPRARGSPATYPKLTPADVRRRESTMGTWPKTFARPPPQPPCPSPPPPSARAVGAEGPPTVRASPPRPRSARARGGYVSCRGDNQKRTHLARLLVPGGGGNPFTPIAARAEELFAKGTTIAHHQAHPPSGQPRHVLVGWIAGTRRRRRAAVRAGNSASHHSAVLGSARTS